MYKKQIKTLKRNNISIEEMEKRLRGRKMVKSTFMYWKIVKTAILQEINRQHNRNNHQSDKNT